MAPVGGRVSGTSSSPALRSKVQFSVVSVGGSTGAQPVEDAVAVQPQPVVALEVVQQGSDVFALLPEAVVLNIFQLLHDERRTLVNTSAL